MTTPSIYFAQTGALPFTWRATCNGTVVARIVELVEDEEYRITYMRTPWANKLNPAKTTRTVKCDLDTVQARIIARGW